MEFLIAAGVLAGIGALLVAIYAIFKNIVSNNKPDSEKPKKPE